MQLQQAYPGGVPQIAPPIRKYKNILELLGFSVERMRNDLIRNIIARHQQLQSIMANANLQQHAAAAVQQAKVRWTFQYSSFFTLIRLFALL